MRRLVVVTKEIPPLITQAPLFEKEGWGGDFFTIPNLSSERTDSPQNLPYPLFTKEENCFLANLSFVDKGQILTPLHTAPIPFSNAKTLLGQELPYAIYDMRAENGVCLNLDALAIVAGTIQSHGTLYLLCPEWHHLEQQLDFDALRWNANQAVSCPNFYRYFKQLVAEFCFEIIENVEVSAPMLKTQQSFSLTTEQLHILHHLPSSSADIHLITAPRGRGKSTISGKLAEKIAQKNSVIITARSRSALPNFWKGIASENIPFFAPDRLLQQIEQQQIERNQWLFVDEAASLPLPTLQQFCAYFAKVVLTTTTQNYEGTGRGFSLKFLPKLERAYQQWQLTKPLRWEENDPLEAFVNRLLLLEERPEFPCSEQTLPPLVEEVVEQSETEGGICKFFSITDRLYCPLPLASQGTSPASGGRIAEKDPIPLYHLLAQAHYKTTPTDLRRLFDGSQQRFYQITQGQRLIAGAWLLEEGGLDQALAMAIWRGERRPQGSLVAQYLCFQGNLPEACQLRSLRISRIAVQPELQQQGYGKRLVLQIFSQMEPLVDFVSVSFGMSPELLKFWKDCGFQLVQITPTVEASSGYPSAMMLYPTSIQGEMFVRQAVQQFQRDQACLVQNQIQDLDDADRQNLAGFVNAKRTFNACFASLKRLAWHYPELQQTLNDYCSSLPQNSRQPNKIVLAQLRSQIKQLNLFDAIIHNHL